MLLNILWCFSSLNLCSYFSAYFHWVACAHQAWGSPEYMLRVIIAPVTLHIECVCVLVAQSCPTLCDCMDCSPPGSSVHGILQARILERIAVSFSRPHGAASYWTINRERRTRVAYPLLTYSRVYKVGRCCWKHSYCVYRVSSAKLPEVRQLTKGIDSAHIGPLPQVMPVWTVDGVWRL